MTKLTDYTDDWMNPQRSASFAVSKRQYPRYLIEREKLVPVFGPGGSITQWDYWVSFDTAEKRDAELKRLRGQHPMWHLRPVDQLSERFRR